MERKILDPDRLADALSTLDGWSVDGPMLKKRLNFENFVASLEFVNRVGQLAEAADHHPDLLINYKRVKVSYSTHSEGGLTEKDFDGARAATAIAIALGGK